MSLRSSGFLSTTMIVVRSSAADAAEGHSVHRAEAIERGQRGILKRRQIEAAALFQEDRDGDLLARAKPVSRHVEEDRVGTLFAIQRIRSVGRQFYYDILHHSTSGWLSGAAATNAGSIAQASNIRDKVG
jgi:hypothetical protein